MRFFISLLLFSLLVRGQASEVTVTAMGETTSSSSSSHNNNNINDIDNHSLGRAVKEISPLGVTFQETIVPVVGADLGVSQILHPPGQSNHNHNSDDSTEQQIILLVEEARQYIQTVVQVESRYEKVRQLCRNQHPGCAFFALKGECINNPDWMDEHCGPMCQSCHELHMEAKCPLDPNTRHAWYPGDQTRMWERIITDPNIQKHYQPTILSHEPRIIMLENFINTTEAQILIQHGATIGYHRSADIGIGLPDGTYTDEVNHGRTSENAWCDDECFDDPVTQNIMQRMEYITGIPTTNSESLQLLRYEPGQFYQRHHDYIDYLADRMEGPRILTIFLYLNDVEEGGETRFTDLDPPLKVKPKLGRAVLWASVKDEDPFAKDPRTHHDAMKVIQGVKYGANAWFHLRDTQGAIAIGCGA